MTDPSPIQYADMRAKFTALWERVHQATPDHAWPAVTRLTSGPELAKVPPHHTAWAVGPWSDEPASTRHIIVQPSLDPAAPVSMHRRLLARVIAIGSGRCPMCSGIATLSRQPPGPGESRAAFHLFAVYVAVRHANGCPADDFTARERAWFPAFNDDPKED